MQNLNEKSALERQVFNNSQFGELRISGTPDKPMFCLNDVCKALGLGNVTALKSRLDEKGFTTIKALTSGGNQQMIFINEPNLYRCIFQSRKAEAEQFQDWVFNEILPSIRKSGGYIATQANETPEMIMARALKVAEHTIEEHEKRMKALAEENEAQKRINKQLEADTQMKAEEIKKLTPDADYARQTLTAVNTWNTNIIAKEMGMSAVTRNQHLQRLGIQYKQHKVWVLSAKYQGKGYTKTQTYNYFNSAGEVCTRMQQEWTEVGRRWLLELWHQGKFSGSAV